MRLPSFLSSLLLLVIIFQTQELHRVHARIGLLRSTEERIANDFDCVDHVVPAPKPYVRPQSKAPPSPKPHGSVTRILPVSEPFTDPPDTDRITATPPAHEHTYKTLIMAPPQVPSDA